MSENLDKLKQEVEETGTVQAAAVTLLNGLGAEIKKVKEELAAQGVTNASLDELSSRLDTTTNDLATAVTANTIAADEQPQ